MRCCISVASVQSSALIISSPLLPNEKFSTGDLGWVHTSFDNFTSTTTLNWIDPEDLENHVKVAALSISRIAAPILVDINSDGIVGMKDIGCVARRFGVNATNPLWDPNVDVVTNGKIDMKDVGTVAGYFGEKDH